MPTRLLFIASQPPMTGSNVKSMPTSCIRLKYKMELSVAVKNSSSNTTQKNLNGRAQRMIHALAS